MADQNYIFISYKGEDSEALEIIRQLQNDGCSIWYDQRLLPSEQWPQEISRRIKGCGYFVTLLTDAFLRSEWCAKELALAQKHKKPILAIHLTKTKLPDGIDLVLADLRGVYRSACKSDADFYQQIYKAKGFGAFRAEPVKGAVPAPVSQPTSAAPTMANSTVIDYPSGGRYTGQTKNGQPHGHGTMRYSYGDFKKRDYYTGEWKNGQRDGEGKLVYRDGRVEEGTWSHTALLTTPALDNAPAVPVAAAKPNAPQKTRQTLTLRDGLYVGEVLDGKPHGHGTMTYSPDQKSQMKTYVGEWKNGLRHGQGKLTWTDGAVYEGSWAEGKRSGYGKLTWKSGNVYEGNWAESKRSGYGKLTWTDGTVYEGAWAEDKRNGHGVLRHADGSMQEGEWVDDRLIETVELLYEDGSRYFGAALEDVPHGSGTMTYAADDTWRRKTYTGEWKNGLRHGSGRMEWTFGDVYDGRWVDGQMCGQGVYHYADGRRYNGEWTDGKQNGKGTFRDEKGMIYSGSFVNGMQEGVFTVYPAQNPGAARKVTYHEDQPVDEHLPSSPRQAKRVMRNDPCPCGRRKPDGRPYKYKECCGKGLQ